MDWLPISLWPWLVLAVLALVGWGIGGLAAARRTPATEPLVLNVRVQPAAAISPNAWQHLRQKTGLALVRNRPEIDLRFSEAAAPDDLTFMIEATEQDGGLILQAEPARCPAVLPSKLNAEAMPGELIAAWLLLHWPGTATAAAAHELSRGHGTFDSLLIQATACARLASANMPAAAEHRQRLRELILAWPGDASGEDRLHVVEMLAAALIAPPHAPATAVWAYEALDLANGLLRAHWAAGRTLEAAAVQHLLSRIRLALGRTESEVSHLLVAREAIAHALAHGPRGEGRANRAADLALLSEIELAAAEHEPGTAALHRAAAASREAIGLTDAGSPDLASRLGVAVAALTAIGEREATTSRLEDAVALARQAHWISASEPSGTALARSLLALGELTHRQALVEEAADLMVGSPTVANRMLRARALEAKGRLNLDAGPLEAALRVWEELARQTTEPLTAANQRLHAHCALTVAKWSAQTEFLDEAVALARAIAAEPAPSALTAALDQALLGETLLCRAESRNADKAGAVAAIACFAEALERLGTEPLPQLKSRLEALQNEAQRLAKLNNLRTTLAIEVKAPALDIVPRPVSEVEEEPALAAIAMILDDLPVASAAQRLVQARRMVLVRLDRLAGEAKDVVGAPEFDWLERIERAQLR